MKLKKMAGVLLAAVLMFAQGVMAQPVLAMDARSSNGAVVAPKWANVSDVLLSLSFANGVASCDGAVFGYSGTTKISATLTLERKNTNGIYTYVDSWSTNANSSQLFVSGTASVASGYTYRLRISANVTRNGSVENISVSIEKKY